MVSQELLGTLIQELNVEHSLALLQIRVKIFFDKVKPKDTIYTKLPLMPCIDDNLGRTPFGLIQFGNINCKNIVKLY